MPRRRQSRQPERTGYDVSNFHRRVVHGSTFPLEYVRMTIDPSANNAADADAFGRFSGERVNP